MQWYVEELDAIARLNHQFVDKFTHLLVGFFVWLVIAVAIRKPLQSILPIGVISVLALANEVIEGFFAPNWNPFDAAGDIVATVLLPGLVVSCLRIFPALRG